MSEQAKREELTKTNSILEASIDDKNKILQTLTSQANQAEERTRDAEQKRATAQTELDTIIPQLETVKTELEQERSSLSGSLIQPPTRITEDDLLDRVIGDMR